MGGQPQARSANPIIREDNCWFAPATVYHDDRFQLSPAVYPNLADQMELPSINQLWVTYVTYIRLETEFVDLALTLDDYSRSVIGWRWIVRWTPAWQRGRHALR